MRLPSPSEGAEGRGVRLRAEPPVRPSAPRSQSGPKGRSPEAVLVAANAPSRLSPWGSNERVLTLYTPRLFTFWHGHPTKLYQTVTQQERGPTQPPPPPHRLSTPGRASSGRRGGPAPSPTRARTSALVPRLRCRGGRVSRRRQAPRCVSADLGGPRSIHGPEGGRHPCPVRRCTLCYP